MAMEPSASFSNRVRRMLGFSLHDWENAMVVFLIVAGAFALLAGAATWAVVRLQRAELAASRQEFEKYKLDAGKEIADAQQRAAEANLELARMKTPRSLTAEQQREIADKLKPWAGALFDVGAIHGDTEVAELELILESVLETAGWQQVDWQGGDVVLSRPGKPATGLITTTGVAIGVYPEKASGLGLAATTLVASLAAAGIPARAGPVGAEFINKNVEAIHILIGRKT
jgi:hypothetical protein